MRRWLLLIGALTIVLTLAGGSGTAYADELSGAKHGGRALTTIMTGAQETPPTGSPGIGIAIIRVNPGRGQVCWLLAVKNLSGPATAAHIHVAPPGVPGPIVVPLTPPTNGFSEGCQVVDRALAKAILQHPEGYYVNVHTANFPAGEIRGQLSKR